MSTAAALLDTPLAPSLDCESAAMTHADVEDHLIEQLRARDPSALEPCRAYIETYRSAVELTRSAEHVEMPAEMKARLRSLLLDELRRGRS